MKLYKVTLGFGGEVTYTVNAESEEKALAAVRSGDGKFLCESGYERREEVDEAVLVCRRCWEPMDTGVCCNPECKGTEEIT